MTWFDVFISGPQLLLIFVVRANPKPIQDAFMISRQSPKPAGNANRPVCSFALKMKGGMTRICFPKLISLASLALNFWS
jgi:hypothetical protein